MTPSSRAAGTPEPAPPGPPADTFVGDVAEASPSDTELLAGAARGDETAWRALYERYRWFVWSIVRGFYQLDLATAEDVAMSVWGKLVVHADRIEQPERLPSWLHRTAYNEAIGTLRRHRRHVPTELDEELEDEVTPSPEDAALEDEATRALVAAFGGLSENCRQLLWLLFFESELSYAGVAEILGRSVGALGPTRSRCLAKLRQLLEQPLREER